MNMCPGVVIGLITDVEDPEQQGRVKVRFPWLREDHATDWVRIGTFMSGKERGSYFMPEVEDEVVVAFEHGDPRFPIVLGFLWNGKDLPPTDGFNTKVRRLKSVSGHLIEFDDNSDNPHIRIETKDRRKVLLDDKSKKIEITDSSGNSITIETQSNTITITSAKDIALKADAGKISLSAMEVEIKATTSFSAKGGTAKVQGDTLMEVKGGIAKVEGDTLLEAKATLVKIN